jgi:hypothetical protein
VLRILAHSRLELVRLSCTRTNTHLEKGSVAEAIIRSQTRFRFGVINALERGLHIVNVHGIHCVRRAIDRCKQCARSFAYPAPPDRFSTNRVAH